MAKPQPPKAERRAKLRQQREAEAEPAPPQQPDPPAASDVEVREQLMKRDVLLVALAGVSLLNGMHFSPYFDPVALLLRQFIAGTILATPLAALYLSSIFVSLLSLLIAGIPAAIYERAKGLKDSTPVSLGIWLATLMVLTIPTFLAMTQR